jgi:DNA modification methylase
MPEPAADAARASEAPPLPEVAISRPGDIWRLGNHTLVVGDFAGEQGAAMAETLLAAGKLEPTDRVSAVFLDPPYGIDFQSNMRVKTPKFRKLQGDTTVLDFAPALNAIGAADMAVYLCCGHQTLPRFRDIYDQHWTYKNTIIWDKGNHSMGDLQGAYASRYEMILFYHRGKPYLRDERPVDIWDYPRIPPKNHPTEKPVNMVEFALVHSSDPGDIVADLTVGSGTTLMAAEASGRIALCGEIDARYADVTIERFLLATKQDATRGDGASYAELKVRNGAKA